jgi:predicted amidohydrolase YtcJ
VYIGFYKPHVDDAITAGLRTGDAVPHTHGLIVTGPLKLITDGSLGSMTAYCHDPYPNSKNRGVFTYAEDELASLCAKATTQGLRLAVHAIGDDANSNTLRVLQREAAAGRAPLPGSTIEDAQLMCTEDIPAFKALGLTAYIQPRHLVDDPELCHAFWPGREARAYPFKWFVDAGIPIKLGSDCPVTDLQPWEEMACAISRAGPGQDAFCPENIIDLATAYAASTSNGRTHVVEGDRADLVVLPPDPLRLDAAGLRAMQVEGTMLGGNWTYHWKN